jgi:hypothetical protein
LFNTGHGLSEKHICTKPFGYDKYIVVFYNGIKITVSRSIGTGTRIGLTNSTGPMYKYLIKTTVAGLVFRLIPQVSFPEYPARIAGPF